MKFSEVAKLALEHRAKTKRYRNEKSFKRWEQVLRLHINPYIGEREISTIDTDTVVDTLSVIWNTKTPTAQMSRVVIHYVIGFAIHKHLRGETDFNPARWKDGLSFDLSAPSDIHSVIPREAISVGEAQRIMPDLANGTIYQKALAFGILTAGRATEFRCATWDEIDFENRMFYVSTDRCKIKRTDPFPVPLSQQAVDLLKGIERKDGTNFVFAGRTGNPPDVLTLQRNLQRSLPKHNRVTTHGCRSTFSSWCAETGKEPSVREACLMHVEGSKVSRAYNRSEMIDRRRLLLQEWADAVYHAQEKAMEGYYYASFGMAKSLAEVTRDIRLSDDLVKRIVYKNLGNIYRDVAAEVERVRSMLPKSELEKTKKIPIGVIS